MRATRIAAMACLGLAAICYATPLRKNLGPAYSYDYGLKLRRIRVTTPAIEIRAEGVDEIVHFVELNARG